MSARVGLLLAGEFLLASSSSDQLVSISPLLLCFIRSSTTPMAMPERKATTMMIQPARLHFFCTRLKCSTLGHALFLHAHSRPLRPRITIMTRLTRGIRASSPIQVLLKIAHIQESQKAPHDQPLMPSGKVLARL